MILVDGGYLSWVYGTRSSMINAWSTAARPLYSRKRGAIILLDSEASFRTQFYSQYKQRRRDRRAGDPKRQEQRDNVKWLVHEVIEPDPSLSCLKVHGLEADDLLTAFVTADLLPKPVRVIGVDKDLLQISERSMRMERISGEPVRIAQFVRRMPKTLQGFITEPLDVLLALTLLGDDSDSVPRIIPPYQLDLAVSFFALPANRFSVAYSYFGELFLRNLYLTVLPGPWCFDPIPAPDDVLRRVTEFRYGWPHMQYRSDLMDSFRSLVEADHDSLAIDLTTIP